jgi:hypothetical protein
MVFGRQLIASQQTPNLSEYTKQFNHRAEIGLQPDPDANHNRSMEDRLMTTDQNTRIETRQAIRTRYAGPTNTRGSRIIVTDSRYFDDPRRRHTYDWDHARDVNENHAQAAQEFLDRYHNATRYHGNKNVIDGPGLCFDDDFYWTWRAAK